ncbi:undecaprenyl-phosphate glucose phosphotransferase [Rhodoligotrophos defluvii]|uniref:undecaprenyl-phosphate glucose phosphotransferase n=1 Tax=Rhodoligotrophos defluvii TaxID=2561934 RepID=UPI001484DE09|nr:undecaprenyl-phosphate glucose phosphotransferase [Rhodoligotrophos defluvii]
MTIAHERSIEGTAASARSQQVLAFLKEHGVTRQVLMDIGAFVEMLIVIGAAVVAKHIYIDFYLGQRYTDDWGYLGVGVLGALVTSITLRRQQLYDVDRFASQSGHLRRFFVGLAVGFLILGAVGYVVKVSSDYSRGWAITWFVIAFVLLLTERKLAVRALGNLLDSGPLARHVVVVGDEKLMQPLLKHMREESGIKLSGFYPYACTEAGTWDTAGLDELINHSRSTRVDDVILALPLAAQEGIITALTRLSQLPVNISVFAGDLMGIVTPRGLSRLGATQLISLQARPMDDWGRIAKSAFDRCASAVLLVLLAPLFAAIAVAIKLDSPGPVLFVQRRHGLNHRVINVLKFRTMSVAEDGPQVKQATSDDPRVTRVGAFLRRTSLDELPQLWNVLRGEMSLVGPRPHAIVHNEYYGELIEAYANRHKVKPGMTGWAQIHGYRGNTEDPELMRKRVEYDLLYIEKWSLSLDLEVLIKTVFKGFVNARAY